MKNLQKNLNAVLIIILSITLLSAYGVQFIYHEEPCPLCMLQRLGMIAVACAAALNIYFGVSTIHYGLMLISALFGAAVALRQISLHVCPGFSVFGFPVLGLSLYTWSFIVFACVIAYVAFLLFLFDNDDQENVGEANNFCKFAVGLILFICFANVITTFLQCGIGVC